METKLETLIHFIQKNYNEEHHEEILSEAYRLLKIKRYELIKLYPNSQNLGFVFDESKHPNSEFNKDIKYSISNFPDFWKELF